MGLSHLVPGFWTDSLISHVMGDKVFNWWKRKHTNTGCRRRCAEHSCSRQRPAFGTQQALSTCLYFQLCLKALLECNLSFEVGSRYNQEVQANWAPQRWLGSGQVSRSPFFGGMLWQALYTFLRRSSEEHDLFMDTTDLSTLAVLAFLSSEVCFYLLTFFLTFKNTYLLFFLINYRNLHVLFWFQINQS